MTTEELKTKVFGKTEAGTRYTFKQWLVYVWFALSLVLLCGAADETPILTLLVLFANFAASAHYLKKLPLPADPFPEDNYTDDDED